MDKITDLALSDFDFELPQERIALYPAVPRRASKLLHINPQEQVLYRDHMMTELPDLLDEHDLLVVNNSRVIPANLTAVRTRPAPQGGPPLHAQIHFTLHKPIGAMTWRAFARPAKRLQVGDYLEFSAELSAKVAAILGQGEVQITFEGQATTLMSRIHEIGTLPLPPYIASQRAPDAEDQTRYQTHFARHDGAVAAPTAGLHFDEVLLADLAARGVSTVELTLHVGAGTFRPPTEDDLSRFVMHAEWGEITPALAAQINEHKAGGGRIVAVGTTSARLLESASDEGGRLHAFSGETDIFITPGYRFRLVDRLITNFHLPRSTLLMLVSALAGRETMLGAYAHAIHANYRFYSFGDACLIENKALPKHS